MKLEVQRQVSLAAEEAGILCEFRQLPGGFDLLSRTIGAPQFGGARQTQSSTDFDQPRRGPFDIVVETTLAFFRCSAF
jgi:hypothetical protein